MKSPNENVTTHGPELISIIMKFFSVELCLTAYLCGLDVGLWPADFPCPAPDLWSTGDHFVGKLSAMGRPI